MEEKIIYEFYPIVKEAGSSTKITIPANIVEILKIKHNVVHNSKIKATIEPLNLPEEFKEETVSEQEKDNSINTNSNSKSEKEKSE